MRQRLKLALNHTSEDLPTLTEQQRELVRTALDNLAEKYGFESLESYEASLHPQIPLEVELALIWTGIFTSSRDIHAVLRPCIYQWWS